MQKGDTITIPTGPFAGKEGEIEELGTKVAKVRVGSLLIEVPLDTLAAVEKAEEQTEDDNVKTTKRRLQAKAAKTGEGRREEGKKPLNQQRTTPPLQQDPPPQKPIVRINNDKEVKSTMGAGSTPVRTAQPTGTRPAPTPFGTALYNVRQITTRRPEEEQTTIFTALQQAVGQLDENGRRNLVFRLQREVMEGGSCGLSGLFTVCRMARMLAVAASTAAVKATGLTFAGLKEVGLAEIKISEKDQKPYTIYRFGAENLGEAIKKLRKAGNIATAKPLEDYVSRGERNRAMQEAVKAAAAEAATTAIPAATTTEPVAIDPAATETTTPTAKPRRLKKQQ